MAVLSEDGRLAGEAGQMALLTESAAGIAVIVLAIIGLAESASAVLAAVATIVIGGGLMVAALNATMEEFQALSMVSRPTAGEQMVEIGGRAVVALMAGVSGVVLGILGVFDIRTAYVIPSALVVFGGYLVLSGAVGAAEGARATVLSHRGSATARGFEILIGVAALVLGSLSLVPIETRVLTLVGFIAVGAALLMIGGTFCAAVLRLASLKIAPLR
ncbi:MAG TPA: hypothetical protein VE993_10200 [Stellaceae bacterium]|nr:hypothetical protein [Stellaceae bacterium]